jgi:exopolyphosphatase/guanosine-5'-triphosphate,3'-diphosphate pyrophosphatase
MTRVGAIDCGTNSIRLLVTDVSSTADGRLSKRDLDRRMTIVRLGEGVDATGRLSEAALARTFAALEDFQVQLETLGVHADAVRMVATSATRDAANRDALVAGVQARVGVDPEVISGAEEARLSYRGATLDLDPNLSTPPRLVVDIGGGSTEIVLGDTDVLAGTSVDIGCVRLTERCLSSDPPSRRERDAAQHVIDAALAQAADDVPLAQAQSMIGLAGTVTTMAGIHLGLQAYDPAAIHGSTLPVQACQQISEWLLQASHDERAAHPVMHPGRVDVIAAGAMVLASLTRLTGLDVLVSERDILDGIAWSILERAG